MFLFDIQTKIFPVTWYIHSCTMHKNKHIVASPVDIAFLIITFNVIVVFTISGCLTRKKGVYML